MLFFYWEQRKLGEYGDFTYGHSAPKWSVTSDATTPCVRYGELYTKFGVKIDKVFSHTNMPHNKLVFSKGTEVLIPRVGEDPYDYNHCTWLSIPNVAIGEMISIYYTKQNPLFTAIMYNATLRNEFAIRVEGGSVTNLYYEKLKDIDVAFPKKEEQEKISQFFYKIDNLITLHQQKNMKGKNIMKNLLRKSELFYEYYEKWISVYKVGAIRDVTMKKYKLTLNWLKKLVPTLEIKDLTRITYQQLLNDYAECHEKQSTMDFHHQLKGAILDAVDEGIIIRDPTRKAIIKGKIPKEKKIKYLNQFELQKLIADLDLGTKINYDWLILLIAKTGMRFSEALAITPKDFDFPHQMIIINKTWDYKGKGGFLPTKNTSSNRKVQLDWQTAIQFSELIKELDEDKPIFFTEKIYNSTINDILERHCKNVNIPTISVHGLRHTHASILLFAGVSIASVAHRLGHSSMTTTQKTYLHIIQELENTDIDLIMRSLTALNR